MSGGAFWASNCSSRLVAARVRRVVSSFCALLISPNRSFSDFPMSTASLLASSALFARFLTTANLASQSSSSGNSVT